MPDSLALYSMFLLGLLGSAHCVGMCGPLVVAIPTLYGHWSAHVAYHLGRIATYTLLGALLAGVGQGLALLAGGGDSLIWMARIQVGFSLIAALFLLLFGLLQLGIVQEPKWLSVANPSKLPGFSKLQQNVGSKKGLLAMFSIGMMLGLLPCGLSYAAFARAMPSGSPWGGGLLVLCFGLGTLPGLLFLGLGAAKFARRYHQVSNLLSGMLMIGMAVSLVLDALQARWSG